MIWMTLPWLFMFAWLESLLTKPETEDTSEPQTPIQMKPTLIEGPFRAKPEVDIEFVDIDGNALVETSALVEPKINAAGLVIEIQAVLAAPGEIDVHGFNMWVGNQRLNGQVQPRHMLKGDQANIKISFAIQLGPNMPMLV
jgi:hypothetical protein